MPFADLQLNLNATKEPFSETLQFEQALNSSFMTQKLQHTLPRMDKSCEILQQSKRWYVNICTHSLLSLLDIDAFNFKQAAPSPIACHFPIYVATSGNLLQLNNAGPNMEE